MICALLNAERIYNGGEGLPTFRYKIPDLPSDVPSMMGFELLVCQINENAFRHPFVGTGLFLLDNAENTHNTTLNNEILLTHLYDKYITPSGGNKFYSDPSMKPIKIYISTKQDYLYFNLQNKTNQKNNDQGFGGSGDEIIRYVREAKLIVRLTFDTRQNEYQPKRIML